MRELLKEKGQPEKEKTATSFTEKEAQSAAKSLQKLS